MKPNGWDITWGDQVDPRVVRLTGGGQISDVAVASYLAKYATKSTEPVGVPPGRITAENAAAYATSSTHQGRLIRACLRVGAHTHEDFKALRRWAHMLGYRGHFATKSRRYSTTMRALRKARRDWHRRQPPQPTTYKDKTVVTETELEWAGRGWRTTGDALLALSAAAQAREHRRIAREEPILPDQRKENSRYEHDYYPQVVLDRRGRRDARLRAYQDQVPCPLRADPLGQGRGLPPHPP